MIKDRWGNDLKRDNLAEVSNRTWTRAWLRRCILKKLINWLVLLSYRLPAILHRVCPYRYDQACLPSHFVPTVSTYHPSIQIAHPSGRTMRIKFSIRDSTALWSWFYSWCWDLYIIKTRTIFSLILKDFRNIFNNGFCRIKRIEKHKNRKMWLMLQSEGIASGPQPCLACAKPSSAPAG